MLGYIKNPINSENKEPSPAVVIIYGSFQSTEKRSWAEKERENSCEQPKSFLTYGNSIENGGTDGKLTQLTTEVNNEKLNIQTRKY